MTPQSEPADIGAVVIGRNEGARLVRCLASLQGRVGRIVYVDSGSTDGSVDAARAAGADVVELDLSRPFTAARARNAGLEKLKTAQRPARYVQFVDGDCELTENWPPAAAAFLEQNEDVAVVCGRLVERHPEASLWNRLMDMEWQGAAGETKACGGIAMMRLDALRAVGGFNPDLIAGEEPELCLRLRGDGWKVWRLEDEMGFHDAAMMRFGQWWRRSLRAGHAFAEGYAMHGGPPERMNADRVRRALIWGLGVPVFAVLGLAATPLALLVLLAWPLQMVRLRLRGEPWIRAVFLTIGKLPEALGILRYRLRRLRNRPAELIEYK